MRIFMLFLVILLTLLFVLSNKRQSNEPLRAFDLSHWLNKNENSYKLPSDRPLSFPQDHGEHTDVQSESWRFSGMLQDRKGKYYGFQVAFSRLNLGNDRSHRQSAWATGNIYRAQMAITLEHANRIIAKQRTSRGALGLAGYRSDQKRLWLHDWQMQISQSPAGQNIFILHLTDKTDHLRLTLQAVKPAIEMSLSKHMKLYGISRMQAEGSLQIEGQSRTVSGVAFFDHAWGNLPLSGGQLVWNRFLLQLSNNQELVILQSRRQDGSGTPIHSGYFIDRNADVVELSRKQFTLKALKYWQSQKSGIRYPLTWRVTIPDKRLTMTIDAMIKDQESNNALVNWSGTVQVAGKSAGKNIQGSGLLQLSGYEAAP